MTNPDTAATDSVAQPPYETSWEHLATAEPIRIRDPLAEVLGMVPEGDPLVVTFADVAKAAGHACPAVAGAYRSTQLALARLYQDAYPVRSEIAVTVGGEADERGLGPMAHVIRYITGAADETGFAGLGDIGGREELLSFGDVEGPGRAFRFKRRPTETAVVVTFDPSAPDTTSGSGKQPPMTLLSKVVSGAADDSEVAAFRNRWHGRVQQILDAPASDGPFTVEPVG